MKVLDLFCGMGGWSIPFVEDGDHVWGVDIEDYGYPGSLIRRDIREIDGRDFVGMDLIIGSPPCNFFSPAFQFQVNRGRIRDVQAGLELVDHFFRIVKEASPRFWAMENVRELETKYWPQAWPELPIWHFNISRGGAAHPLGEPYLGAQPGFPIPSDAVSSAFENPAQEPPRNLQGEPSI